MSPTWCHSRTVGGSLADSAPYPAPVKSNAVTKPISPMLEGRIASAFVHLYAASPRLTHRVARVAERSVIPPAPHGQAGEPVGITLSSTYARWRENLGFDSACAGAVDIRCRREISAALEGTSAIP